jgi:hypothetical protein
MRALNLSAILVVLVMTTSFGCALEGERGFKSSETQFMEELEAALGREGIPFRRDADGFIRYEGKHQEAVERIRSEVERNLSGGIAVKYEDKESRNYLKSLLSSRGMKYRVESRNDGEWIRWYPTSDSQKEEIQMMVVQHNFDMQRQKMPSNCNAEKTPSNTSLNKDAAQKARRAC